MQAHDPFDRCKPGIPADLGLTRTDRVKLLAEAAEALLSGRMPSDAGRLFLAGGLRSWLSEGGDLLRDYWKVKGKQGSTYTPSVLWHRMHDADDDGSSRRATGEPGLQTIDTPQPIL